MLTSTLMVLRCPRKKKAVCGGELDLAPDGARGAKAQEIQWGELVCRRCHSHYPILAGVAILVEDVGGYLLAHVKGISKLVPDSKIPSAFRAQFAQAKREIQTEHIEEDLEADRVTALYVMNHYLTTRGVPWWRSSSGKASREIEELILKYWDHGPFACIEDWVKSARAPIGQVIELGCGVGGLYRAFLGAGRYLGIDNSFASIALARHLALGAPYPRPIRIPADLLEGTISRSVPLKPLSSLDGRADYVVGDLENPPVPEQVWDFCVALNTMDMMMEPEILPELQLNLLKKKGVAIQSCPYIWHEAVAKHLRKLVPKELRDSAGAVEWLYERAGFSIVNQVEHLPWVFFKHLRQVELYSVHIFLAEKPGRG